MRKTLRVLPLALALSATGCNDMLTEVPESFLTTDTYYRTASDLASASTAAYAPLTSEVFAFLSWAGIELVSDQGRIPLNDPSPRAIVADVLMLNSGTDAVTNQWGALYQVIFRANQVIDRAPAVTMDETQKARLVAEAKFLRGWAYLTLTKMYGDAPLLLSEADHLQKDMLRTSTAEIHAQIVKDLTEAEAVLPVTRPAAEWGRVRKGAAQMALADLYLWRSSFLKHNEWQQASDWAKRVIDSGTYRLNDNFISTFLPNNKVNPEMIFVATSSGTNGRSSSISTSIFFPRDLVTNQGGGFGIVMPTTSHYNSYASDDYRREVGYRTSGCNPQGRCVNPFVNGPSVWKYRPSNNGVPMGLSDVDIPIYRYAEALLIYAEAQNELGNTAEALQHVNMVRARARKGTGSETRAQPADLTSITRNAIYMERNWELAHEAKRWFDLVRRDSLEPGYWESQLRANDPNSFSRGGLTPNKKRWPVPQREIDSMPTLQQNPGY